MLNAISGLLKPITDIMIAVLQFFYGYVHSYGWSIILLTLAVRIVILPLTIKQSLSMKDMQRVQPMIKELQQKHKGDKEKLGQETLKLYQEHKVNPLSGCLPLILQLPVFFALFTVLRTYKPLQGTSFYAIENLSLAAVKFGVKGLTTQLAQAYPYYLLIIVIVASTYFSQKQTVTDPQQAKTMAFMPVLIGVISFSLPAGVLLYWTVFNVAMVVQQYITDLFLGRKEQEEPVQAKKAGPKEGAKSGKPKRKKR